MKTTQEFPHDKFSNLTVPEAVGIIELMHYFELVESEDDFEKLFNVLRKVFGFRYVMAGVVNISDMGKSGPIEWKTSEIRHYFTKNGFPGEWIKEYFDGTYYRYDKVLHLLQKGPFAKTWDELYADCVAASDRMVFDGAKAQGLYPGLTVCHADMALDWGSFISCAGCAEGNDKRLLPLIDYVLGIIHDAFVNIVTSSRKSDSLQDEAAFPGSSREKAIAVWICEGKTNPEIARIVGMSNRAVRYHVERLFEKFGVNNRTLLAKELLGRFNFSSISDQSSS